MWAQHMHAAATTYLDCYNVCVCLNTVELICVTTHQTIVGKTLLLKINWKLLVILFGIFLSFRNIGKHNL